MAKGEGKVVAQNKKAHHDYTIVDTLEAGMVLTGTEIKSVRAARINLKDGFAQVKNGEVWLSNVHIAPYEEGNIWNQEPERRRKLLLHKKQIQKLEQETKGTGMTLVPLKVYIKDGYAKLLLGLPNELDCYCISLGNNPLVYNKIPSTTPHHLWQLPLCAKLEVVP